MAKKNGIQYVEKIIKALKNLPSPLVDIKHGLSLYISNNLARSNETRYEHIAKISHSLSEKDISYIPKGIKNAKLRKDKYRKGTFEYIYKRKGNNDEYIRIYIKIDKKNAKVATIKTIFVTKSDK